jgi:hypothetical protein
VIRKGRQRVSWAFLEAIQWIDYWRDCLEQTFYHHTAGLHGETVPQSVPVECEI